MDASNVKAMRDALVKADAAFSLIVKSAWFIEANFHETKEVMDASNAITSALAAPPRNCDVGTVEEQITRHRKWCKSDNCLPGIPCSVCFAKWSQMPYEEGETK